MPTPAFRFIDLFAGVGGFHAALSAYGGECAYAVEIDKKAAQVYARNWGIDPFGDITNDANDEVMNVPPHEVLVAGFPCQPFSKSGAQRGMDETRGTLYWNILRIIEQRRPKVVVLENVRNLAGPRHVHEWQVIIETLREQEYRVSESPAIFSPHLLPPDRGGRPQVRERVFITATHNPDGIDSGLPVRPPVSASDVVDGWDSKEEWHLEDILDDSHNIPGCELTSAERLWIDAWNDFVELMWEERNGRRLPGFPIWADSWRDYRTPIPLDTPDWKVSHLSKNYEFYAAHKELLDAWAIRWGVFTDAFPASRRKLEWQAQDTPRLWDTVMHFRPSGIRAKRPTYLPALVAITQTSIVGPRERRLSPRETARLQGFPDWFDFGPQPPTATYKQMGNGVNVGVVWHVFREHVKRDEDVLKRTEAGRRILAAVLDAPPSPDGILSVMQHPAPGTSEVSSASLPARAGLASNERRADRPFFFPAETSEEAIARIYSLTGAADRGTRGEKRAIVALRDALDLDIDLARTNVYMGREVAEALGVEWRDAYENANKINLVGLNALLEGATDAYRRNSLRRLEEQRPPGLTGPLWAAFDPARSKIEAVNRISALTHSGPEWLGPGSKERKSVLVNLARALAPQIDVNLSKTKLGAALAREFGAPWSPLCESTGETISLVGLNTLLAGAERRLDRLGASRAMLLGTPEEEGSALAAALMDAWRAEVQPDGGKRVVWDGRSTIEWMLAQGLTNGPNQNEWQGFYWESRGRAVLNNAFAPNPNPPRVNYGNTVFDYSLRFVWDLKAHTESWFSPQSGTTKKGRAAAPLNDAAAMDECIDEQGLGFLMVGGRSVTDEDGSFVTWHRNLKAANGVKSKPSNSGNSTPRKAAFEPLHVEAFYFPNTSALEAAKAAGQITGFAQGPQPPKADGTRGDARKGKYNLHVPKARDGELAVARYDWPHSDPRG